MKAIFFILCLNLFMIPGSGFAGQGSEFYALPAPEAGKFISVWLFQDGFTVKQAGDDQGRIRLSAEKSDERWKITLSPNSALATKLEAEYTRNGVPDPSQVDRLTQSLVSYITGRKAVGGAADEPIPNVVLSRIESVVCLESVVKGKRFQFSGFIIDQDGLILATAHDLKGHQRLQAVLFDGRRADGEVIRADHKRDLALIGVHLKSSSHISLEDGRNLLGMGEKLFSVGCPVNLRGTVFPGFINGPPRRVKDQTYWQVEMKIHPGSSGSPVFDSSGNIAAVVKGRLRGTDSVGFLIPFETVIDFVREIDSE